MLRKGAYILILELGKPSSIGIGKLGEFHFNSGYYTYIGSALNSLDGRLKRYFQKSPRKVHWHIDYFMNAAEAVGAYYCESEERLECRIAEGMAERYALAAEGFGSSDCKCPGHLFFLGKKLPEVFKKDKLGLRGIRLINLGGGIF